MARRFIPAVGFVDGERADWHEHVDDPAGDRHRPIWGEWEPLSPQATLRGERRRCFAATCDVVEHRTRPGGLC